MMCMYPHEATFRHAIRKGDTETLNRLWELYNQGQLALPRNIREELVVECVNDKLVVDWLMANKFLPTAPLLKSLLRGNSDPQDIEHFQIIEKFGNNPEVWTIFVDIAITYWTSIEMLQWASTKYEVDIQEYISDDVIQFLMSAYRCDENHYGEGEENDIVVMLRYLCDKEYLQLTRDMLDTALTTGKNIQVIQYIVATNPTIVCQATAVVALESRVWSTQIWSCLLEMGHIVLDDQEVNHIIDVADWRLDGRIFMKYGASFTERHALTLIQKRNHCSLQHLVRRCGVEPTPAMKEEIYKSGDADMINAWKSINSALSSKPLPPARLGVEPRQKSDDVGLLVE